MTWLQGQWLYIRLIDQFSGSGGSAWYSAAENARYLWSTANGPQILSWSAHSNDSWMYLNYSWTGQHDLQSSWWGITWNCDNLGACQDYGWAINIKWTDIYLNRDNMDTGGYNTRTNTFAHEIGHGFGLAHHSDPARLMNPVVSSTVLGPTDPGDIGKSPACYYGGSEWGIRCIYNWN